MQHPTKANIQAAYDAITAPTAVALEPEPGTEAHRKRYGRWDEECIETMLQGIRQAVPTVHAALRAGIHKGTFYRRMKDEGAAGDELRARVEQAEAEGVANRVARITLAGTGRKAQFDRAGNCTMPAILPNWAADRWMLAVRFAEHFGTKDRLELGGPGDGPVEHRFVVEYLDPTAAADEEDEEAP